MLNHYDIVAIILFLAMMLLASTAQAGSVSITNGQVAGWTSTHCVAPQKPAALSTDPELPANSVNASVMAQNDYARALSSYMQCLAREAEADANSNSQAIISAAQSTINGEQQKATMVTYARPQAVPQR